MSKEIGTISQEIFSGSDARCASSDATLFSSSLPVNPHEKLKLNALDHGYQSLDDTTSSLEKLHLDVEDNGILEDVENHAIGRLLPDDEDELLAGIIHGFELGGCPNRVDDLEEYDLFGSGGGLELETDQQDRLSTSISRISLSDGAFGNRVAHNGTANGVGTVSGEHPLGEHPSRTLFVRNINSYVEDSELRSLFEQYGDIRTLYTACKHRGFVMISYYDIRAARTAMRALQDKPLRRRKLDIHFSIPKDNPSDKDINQGTLVVFNLDPSVSNDDLRQIFGVYGEIKEIRETPHKRHHKFIEYYDVRAAEAALKFLNRSDIAGKRIKLEPSRPGGARRNLMLNLNQELGQDESRIRHQMGTSMGTSPPGNWPKFGSPVEHSPLQTFSRSPGFRSTGSTIGNNLPGLASILHPQASVSRRVAPIVMDHFWGSQHIFSNGTSHHRTTFQHSHSFPEPRASEYPGTVSSYGASSSDGSGIERLSGPEFLWGSPKVHPGEDMSSARIGQSLKSNGQSHGFSFSNHLRSFFNSSQLHQHHHHVGSAPSDVPFERHFGFYQESPETAFMKPAFGGVALTHYDRTFMVNVDKHVAVNAGVAVPGNIYDNGSPSSSMMSPPGPGPMFLGLGNFPGLAGNSLENFTEPRGNQQIDSNGTQMDNQKQFQLNLDKIRSGEDTRTTLMIKNIPNKYTSMMLLAAIDESHKGTYDFLYLPIDFKNKCNMGYAFINMLSPSHIIPFYETFNGKKWEKFNSEKVASLAYARIQGKATLVARFQNSSLMNEDKRCRPILFHSESSESSVQIIQEHLPSSSLNIQFRQSKGSDSEDPPSLPKDA